MLPDNEVHSTFFNQLAETVRTQGGTALVLATTAVDPTEEVAILARFHSDRAREYDEFADRARSFLAEIDKETTYEKFTHAELEELKGDLDKLSAWIKKIKARDFLPDHRVCETTTMLDSCIKSLNTFSEKVYLKEGVVESTEDNPKWRLSERPPRCAPDA